MATNYNGLRKTVAVLEEIQRRVSLLKLANGEKAFETILIFNVADLAKAIRSFIAARNRVCVIVFDGDDFHDAERSEGIELNMEQTRKIDLLVSDRVIGADMTKALLGTTDDHPGALALKDLVTEELPGLLFPNPQGIVLKVLGSETAFMQDKDMKEQPGRVGVLIHFDARGGLLTKRLDRASVK